MDDNDKQMTLPGMEDSDELTNPLTSSTKELVTELLQDAANLTPQRRALCTLLLTCARTIDRLCRKGRDISRMVTSLTRPSTGCSRPKLPRRPATSRSCSRTWRSEAGTGAPRDPARPVA